MYARYVPSKKKEAQAPVEPSAPPPPPAPEPSAIPASEPVVTEGTTAAVPYARFVPSKKPRTSYLSAAPTEPDVLSPATKRKHEEPVEAVDTPVKKKKSRKSETGAASDEEETSPRKSAEKKQKKKRESEAEVVEEGDSKEKKDRRKKKKDREQDEDAEDDTVDRRHKDVLAKATKYLKKSAELIAKNEAADKMDVEEEEEKEEEYDLVPLPQPEPTALDTSKPSYETLPPWLAAPIRVAPDTRTPFADIGINPKAAQILESKGFKDAFAVQTAALPLLLPSCKHRQGDVLVAAATGSGKTLAYALPIVRDISQGAVTRLRALVVLPTRELVKQAQEVFELCASAFDGREQKRVRIGISIGSQQLKHEQASLIEKGEKYDPEAYRVAHQRELEAWKDVEDTTAEDEDAAVTKPTVGSLPDHIVDYTSKVDVLICTPGRLVEHINLTPGFSLDYVRWMVVDEADKLLAQSFQGWLDTVMPKLSTNKFSARDFPDSNLSGVRKVVLSATLTRDLSLLSGLQLRRPQLIVLEGEQADSTASIAEHTLPTLLKESAIRVHDANLKPLYLIDLLLDGHLMSETTSKTISEPPAEDDATSSSDDSLDSDSSSDSDSDSDSDSSSDASSTAAAATTSKSSTKPFTTTALIFTKSNESALRLSRLISLLHPSLAPSIATLTSTQKTSDRRRALRAFAARRLRLLVASDLVARGIDLPLLDNVINYDLPASAAGYVHRVGRTARAGRAGAAWTLVEDGESGWFWGKIAKPSSGIRRAEKVDRLRIGDPDSGGFEEERVQKYEEALEKLGKEAGEARRQR
ncbi:DEAD/DEAH box helicase [Colletotrichum scovillei]|uniref:ATP-dependent RNA helicase n=1 Tax=Colletotrichum scovillei TaxID=1209932 RepID=A0A9P7RDM4_9PEZI|nr:DEAD/DEAH box helicase [Colletotrichum scovillei]KAF4776021.1 DEAD/DEAH box helicase [Colletotrichum scovillei]KAG7053719.1 ATP-dependent RNA helicase dbp6 [Colletotrichum scovillei]KAG7072015.1 ATP-dependent RNA helicase dbp6 [Colletotrichum scovillei]KAG7080198.1 ATP-dependent RNA helicase dbp6 [Colletotrichum scovillei]